METRVSTLTFVILGLAISFSTPLVESQHHEKHEPAGGSPHPSDERPRPAPSSSPAPPPSLWNPSSSRPPPHRHPPPPPVGSPKPRASGNAGKKIGLVFLGIAAILQIGVVGFLVFKRTQLLRMEDRYESCSP